MTRSKLAAEIIIITTTTTAATIVTITMEHQNIKLKEKAIATGKLLNVCCF
jgi:hypothetical protein